jgi:hypothetical protein
MQTSLTQNITRASEEWRSRPNDQRYLSLESLGDAVRQRRRESWTVQGEPSEIEIIPAADNKLSVKVYDRAQGERLLTPTNFAFGQLAQYAQAPGAYLRQLPAELAAINLQWGLEHRPVRDNVLSLAQSNGEHRLRAMTSTSYGRIWDADVVAAVDRVNQSGRWQIPSASYAARDPKRATTLYASDRDVFIFLVDPSNPIEVGGETLYRGFYTWNSEVGACTFGLATFLYRYVCDNRIIWGATNVQELKVRHTGGAPERFAHEGARYLSRYADETTVVLTEQIARAQAYELPASDRANEKQTEGWGAWLKKRGFTDSLAKSTVAAAQAEEGQARSLWDIVQGVTAHARSIQHTDERVKIESLAGKLMQTVA